MSLDSSLTSHVVPHAYGEHVIAATFLGGKVPAFALANGEVVLVGADGETRVAAHPDAGILVAATTGGRLVTGGDDGRVVEIDANGSTAELGNSGGKWIDAVAVREDGTAAWAYAKEVRARDAKGEVKSMTAPSGVRGLAFLPKGYRLALAHYNGVSLWFPNVVGTPEFLEWKGSHLDVVVSADGRFVVSSMQENALHGWRIADHKNMRMTGYPAKTRSMVFSGDGNWLATSGAEACIVWPFQGKDGPMGKAPRECGVRPARVTQCAFHPRALVIAIGYQDGWVMMVRMTDGAELLVRSTEAEAKSGAISALAWSPDGRRLVFGAEDGAAGVLDLPAV